MGSAKEFVVLLWLSVNIWYKQLNKRVRSPFGRGVKFKKNIAWCHFWMTPYQILVKNRVSGVLHPIDSGYFRSDFPLTRCSVSGFHLGSGKTGRSVQFDSAHSCSSQVLDHFRTWNWNFYKNCWKYSQTWVNNHLSTTATIFRSQFDLF